MASATDLRFLAQACANSAWRQLPGVEPHICGVRRAGGRVMGARLEAAKRFPVRASAIKQGIG